VVARTLTLKAMSPFLQKCAAVTLLILSSSMHSILESQRATSLMDILKIALSFPVGTMTLILSTNKSLPKFPREQKIHMAADYVTTEDDLAYPVEYLNTLTASGLPLARLALKPGCPLMLLRNVDPVNKLCNGTRMILLQIKPRVLECRILGGDGKTVFIPRMMLRPNRR
jgi:hypothetical protein